MDDDGVTALRHVDERLAASASEFPVVPDPHDQVVDDVLDDGNDRAGQVPESAAGQAAAARLVARKARLVHEQDARAGAGKVDGGRRAGRPCTGHEDVEPLHRAIVV